MLVSRHASAGAKKSNYWGKISFARKDQAWIAISNDNPGLVSWAALPGSGLSKDKPDASQNFRPACAKPRLGGAKAGRKLLYFNSRGLKGNNPRGLLPRKVANLMTLRDSKVLERDRTRSGPERAKKRSEQFFLQFSLERK